MDERIPGDILMGSEPWAFFFFFFGNQLRGVRWWRPQLLDFSAAFAGLDSSPDPIKTNP